MRSEVALALMLVLGVCAGEPRYLGRELGALSELHHGVRGRVYAVDSRTLFIKDFHYDGEGPAAFFYVGSSKTPSASGATRLRDERGGTGPIRRYRGEGVTLSLPDGVTLKDVKWFFVWCDEYSVNFGDVRIPRDVAYPRPARVGALRGVHGVSSDPIVVVDAQTLLVPNFSYDGEAPDAKFWVGRGATPSPQGIRIPDENGKETPLRKYDKKTIVLTLPGELTVFDIGHFAVWCEAFTVNFGHVTLDRSLLDNVPPSLKMLGVSPQSKLNCEVLYDELAFEVRWAVAGDSVVFQLVAKLEDGEYMSFGMSGDDVHSQMVGGDVAVAWVDKQTLKGYAHDYYLDAKSQCAGVRGSCPDERLGENTNSIRLLNAALVNGYSIVTYQRSLKAADELDRAVHTNGSQPIIWAIGPLNSRNEVSYHSHFTKGDKSIEFGRPPVWNCPMPEGEDEHEEHSEQSQHSEPKPAEEIKKPVIRPNPVPTPKPVAAVTPWDIPAVQCHEPADGVFYAQMGPTGGKQGYSAITGHVGWGISWYINGLLIPEINVVRGKKYTFVVEGGSDPSVPARYHPFYITNDPVGGYYHKNDKEKEGIEIYAGVRRTRSGDLLPSGVGRLCNWTPDTSGPEADEFPSFGAYQRSLTLVCEEGNPGVVTWTPDRNTPDTVYYQCFTHRHLGWKINVLDECDASDAEESRVVESVAAPDDDLLEGEESVQVQTRVKPDDNFLDQRKKVEKIINTKNDFSSNKGEDIIVAPQRNQIQPGQEYELPITKGQIKEVIEAVESLESKMKDEMRNNSFSIPSLTQYQVNEDVNEFVPEQPIREGDEYIIEKGKLPEVMLPPSQKPLTLQSVMRPNGKPIGNMRPPFRRPVPPEIKLYSSPYHKNNGGNYPLPMPTQHQQHGQSKKPYPNKQNNRPPNMNRPMGTPPMKPMHSMHQNYKNNKPHFNHGPPKTVPKPQSGQGQNNQKPINGPTPNNMPKPLSGPVFNNIPKSPNGASNLQSQNKPQNVNTQNIQKSPSGPVYIAPKPQNSKNSNVQSIIMGKPMGTIHVPPQSQTLSLGRTDIIANQVVKSQITLPGNGDSLAQHSVPQSFLNKPGQIILGKPMDNPVPLDQQMTPTKQVIRSPVTPAPESHPSSTLRIRVEPEYPQQPSSSYDMKSSDFIGEKKDVSTLNPAINTGFKPESIVIESGFKPIIREPLMAGEDRIADYDGDSTSNMNRREDTDVEENYDDTPQYITNHAYPPSDKITETFEPMFIPSPPDHLLASNDRTKEVFPSNHAKEDRPHPVYVKTESELNALFSKKNMDKDVPSDMVMEADRVSPHYLPPDPKNYSQKLMAKDETFTTYDGKTVSAATLTSVDDVKTKNIFSSKLPSNSELLLKTPQFGPFKGEIPPLVVDELNKETPKPSDARTTHLKLVNSFKSEENFHDDLKPEASEIQEKVNKTEEHAEQKENQDNDYDEDEGDEEYEENDEGFKLRNKRDTKTTQFERGIVEEVTSTEGNIVINNKNQVDFQHSESAAASSAYKLQWSFLVVLLAAYLMKH